MKPHWWSDILARHDTIVPHTHAPSAHRRQSWCPGSWKASLIAKNNHVWEKLSTQHQKYKGISRILQYLLTNVLPTWRTLKREGALISYLFRKYFENMSAFRMQNQFEHCSVSANKNFNRLKSWDWQIISKSSLWWAAHDDLGSWLTSPSWWRGRQSSSWRPSFRLSSVPYFYRRPYFCKWEQYYY